MEMEHEIEKVVSQLKICAGLVSTPNGDKDKLRGNGVERLQSYYWPKGTGYGFESDEQVLEWDPAGWEGRKEEEERQMKLLDILKRLDKILDQCSTFTQPEVLAIEQNLVPVLKASLRNDSPEEIAKFPGTYKLVLAITRKLLTHYELHSSISSLLNPLKLLAESANVILKFSTPNVSLGDNFEVVIEVAQQIMALRDSFNATLSFPERNSERKIDLASTYIEELGPGQFEEVEKFEVHHFASQASPPQNPKRILFEMAGWASGSLPLSFSSSIFLRKSESDMTVLKALITGPDGTPYSGGCFIFDIRLPESYPSVPPLVNLQTTGNRTVRFNPNLYNCGKVCLSLLGTWGGGAGENWNSSISTLLQVLVSIQSLILVEHPFFNEPGEEVMMNSPEGDQSSYHYNSTIQIATVKHAMLNYLRQPPKEFEAVIKKHFYLKRDQIMAVCSEWIAEAKRREYSANELENNVEILKQELANLNL